METMYKLDAVNCQQYSQQSPDNLTDMVLMVVLSIQQNWLGVGDQMLDVRKCGADSKFLWGNKIKTYEYLRDNSCQLYADAMAVIDSDQSDRDKARSLMEVFLRVTGLGIPKAGFVCQLMAGLVGCMDVHNIRMYGLDIKSLSLAKNPKTSKGIDANNKKVVAYIDMCHDIGTEKLWNNWCNFLATKSKKWRDGSHVSAVHYSYLTN
tara:strand:+ start:93 stop:713 length:621 start_codon:yes stop_codon:yes gene_type:complete